MPVALYPGTFDPITFGHIDIARRAASIFNKIIAVVAENPSKKTTFTAEERLAMAREALNDVDNIEVVRYDGLTVNCMREYRATFIVRGLRALSDFDYEFQMALTNRSMNSAAETVFLMPSVEYIYLNSTMVKQIAALGGDVGAFVPQSVQQQLHQRLAGTA
ncbi:MAG: pantetheine-phosphate adenylyltransferase [Chitinivibrionales bacterium]|nr:pantetheine-phosphate adenylyltransferase [Chitinivibrionales bacterium]